MAKKNIKRATFITVEGLEGSGKSSVINFIARKLKKNRYKVKIFREPGSTAVGEKIRRILLDKKNKNISPHTELLLYLAARTQLIEEKLKRSFLKYDFIVCDRFFDSTLVYQGYGLKMGKIVQDSVKIFALGVVPDLTFFLNASPRVGLQRIKNKDRIESRSLDFHNRLRRGYLALAKKYPRRVKVVDARGDLADVYAKVSKLLRKFIKKDKIK